MGRAWILLVLLSVPARAGDATVVGETGAGDAAGDRAREPVVWRDEVVVTATRAERPADEVGVVVEVIDAEELELAAATTLDGVLARSPAFSLLRRADSRTAHPTTQGVSLRGIGPSGASRTVVLVDGVPVNDPFGGWVAWSRLPRAGLERVELARGAGSGVWGSDALGGVIQLLTRSPESGWMSAEAEGGSHGEARAAFAAGQSGRRWSGLIDARWLESAAFPVVRDDQRGPIDVDAFSRHGAVYGKARRALGDSAGVALKLNLADETRGNGTPLTGNATRGGFLALGFDRVGPRGDWQGGLTLWDQTFENRFSAQAADRSSERPALDQRDVSSRALRLDSQRTGSIGERHRLSVGGDLHGVDAATAEDFFFSGTVADGRFLRRRRAGGERLLTGLFLQDEIALGRLSLDLALRLDRWRTGAGFRREVDLESGAVVRDDAFADRDAVELSPRVAVRAALGGGATLHGALYRGFRAPSVNELYRPFRVRSDITAANADLVPESLIGAELGSGWRRGRWTAGVTAFWNRFDDAVTNLTLDRGPGVIAPCGFVPAGGLCRQRRNLEEVRVRGVEADVTWRPAGAWWLTASGLWSDAELRRSSDVPELAGRRLPQAPEARWVAAIEHRDPSRLAGRLELRWVGDQFEDDLNERRLRGVLLVGLTLRRQLPRNLEIFVAAENLLDETVEAGRTADDLVTVAAPRLVHGGLRWRLVP